MNKKQDLMILTGYRAHGVELYKPKRNKKKVAGMLGMYLILPDIIVTSAILLINKVNPVWVYR